MPQINLDMSAIRQLADKVGKISKQARAKAIGRGLGKVAKQGNTAAKTEITKTYNIKAGEVGRRLSVRMRAERTQAVLVAKSNRTNRIDLAQFGARPTKKSGVRFKVLKGGSQQRLAHAFQGTMRSGKRGIFMRVPGKRTIAKVMGIDVTHMFAGHKVRDAVINKIEQALPRVIAHELKYELTRLLK